MSKIYFYLEESPIEVGKYLITPNHENLHLNFTKGSYNLIASRIMNTTYGNYLRMCRDEFGAKIKGKNQLYPIVYFDKTEKVKKLVNFLNKRAAAADNERKKYLKENNIL
jgi:hypothetical protein